MTDLSSLVRTAILGTQQAPPTLDVGDAEANALLERRSGDDPERAFLRTAALVATVRRATIQNVRFDDRDEAAPDEILARCGPHATSDLREILFEGRMAQLAEWLAIAARFERRVPEELIPALLARGVRARDERRAIDRVVGNRGRWLAGREPAWSYAIESTNPEATFAESGDRADRLRALNVLRRNDAARARIVLESSWEREASNERAVFLEALEHGLDVADEDFLERTRTDKRKDVRTIANRLLHRLPHSQSARRAIVRSQSMLVLQRSTFGKRSLAVELPDACTPDMIADGIDASSDASAFRASFLEENVAVVPIAFWLERFDVSLATLFDLARQTDDASALLSAFSRAIGAYRDRAAYDSLLASCALDMTLLPLADVAHRAFGDARPDETPFLTAFRRRDVAALEFSELAARPWSRELSSAALEGARAGLEANADWRAHQRRADAFDRLATNVDPQTPGMLEGWPETYAAVNTRDVVSKLQATLAFRADMHAHLKDGT